MRRHLGRLQAGGRSNLPAIRAQALRSLITEATFGLPVFRHESAAGEGERLIASIAANPDPLHLLGVMASASASG